jgi:LPS export ABC transporter permease LptG
VATGVPLNLPRPSLLDVYVSRQYLGIFFLTVFALLGIFYISTFIDLTDKLFRGSATTRMVLSFIYFKTPQYVYYVIPIGVLVSTLVTIGVMTKNSELVVIKACGISLYRVAAPLVLFALVASAALFTLQERVLASFMREADRLERAMRGFPPLSLGWLDRRWIVSKNGDIYHYEVFDPLANRFTHFSIFHLDDRAWRLASLTYAKEVLLGRQPGADGQPMPAWLATQGWTRDLTVKPRRGVTTEVAYSSFGERHVPLETPNYFKTEEPQADQMTYGQLSQYIAQLKVSGFNVVPAMVELQHKLAFPFVTLIMTLLAVPFAVTTGRRGALYGIGAGIVLAIVYWMTLSVFKALGAGGVLAPALAAWAPNVLFGAAAAYMILTVRT